MKKKLSLTIVSLMCLGVLGLQSCNDTSSNVGTTSEATTSEETTSTDDVVYTSVSITNKAKLQEEWKLEEADRTVDIATDPAANILALLNDGTIVVSSSDSSIISTSGKKITAVGVGKATITVTLKAGNQNLTDTVEITVDAADEKGISIAEVRKLDKGTLAKTRGYVTRIVNDGEYAIIADGESAIELYKIKDFAGSIKVGDLVLASGTYSPYNGLAEIGSLTSVVKIEASENTDVATPVDLEVADWNAIPDGSDGRIVDIKGMVYNGIGDSDDKGNFSINLSLNDVDVSCHVSYHNGDTILGEIRDLFEKTVLTSTVDFKGLLSTHNGYQLSPMSASEFSITPAKLTEAESLKMLQNDLGELDYSAGTYEIADLPVADTLAAFSVSYEVSAELTDVVAIDAATGKVTVADIDTAATGTITATIKNKEDVTQGDSIVINVKINAVKSEPAAVTDKTLADLAAVPAEDFKTVKYTGVTGYISNLKDDNGTKYGNFDVASDTAGTDKIIVHGATATTGSIKFDNHTGSYYFSNPKDFLTNEFTSAIKADDQITFNAIRYAYDDTAELSIEITAINGVSTIKEPVEGATTVKITASELGYEDETKVTGEDLTSKVGDDNLVFTIDKGSASNDATYYDNGSAIRLYQGGASLSFTSAKVIVGFSVTFSSNHNGLDGEAVFAGVDSSSAVAVEESNTFEESEGIKFGQIKSGTEKADRAYISEIVISYIAD